MWPQITRIEGISTHQLEAVKLATAGSVGVLNGGPGVGKTTVAGALLRAAVNRIGLYRIRVAAPTGKAAVRLTAVLQQLGIRGLEATTNHRMLGVSRPGYDGDGWGFEHHAENPIPADLIAIDEVSMLDVDMAASVFSAVGPECSVLLIGDTGQLPPVQHGAFLRDLVAAGAPCGELTEIWRNAGDIVKVCHAIRRGESFEPSDGINIGEGRNFLHVESRTPDKTITSLRRLLRNTPPDIDPLWDCQVMVAVNEKSRLCRTALNKILQADFNPGQPDTKSGFRLNDKVICLKNTGLPLVQDGKVTKTPDFVANGEIGQVIETTPRGAMWVRFDFPSRTVQVGGEHLKKFDLAYVITVHKSQGSQWPVAIYVSDDYRGARFVASRELIYTALSRAEKLAVTIGRWDTIVEDCQREALSKRKTFLRELLTGEMQ